MEVEKGPSPEGVAVGRVEGCSYAYIGLERIVGIVVYEITNPYKIRFADYLNNRDFSVASRTG